MLQDHLKKNHPLLLLESVCCLPFDEICVWQCIDFKSCSLVMSWVWVLQRLWWDLFLFVFCARWSGRYNLSTTLRWNWFMYNPCYLRICGSGKGHWKWIHLKEGPEFHNKWEWGKVQLGHYLGKMKNCIISLFYLIYNRI